MALFQSKEITRVKVLGVRTEEETKVIATYNSTVYCLLVAYKDGSSELKEVNAKEMNKYIAYIPMD